MSIKLKINLPERALPTIEADKVVLPIREGTLTVINDRAPELRLLTAGSIAILNQDNQVVESWKIDGGVAEIAQDVCTVLTGDIEKCACHAPEDE